MSGSGGRLRTCRTRSCRNPTTCALTSSTLCYARRMDTPNSAPYDELILTVKRCIERAEDRMQKFAIDLHDNAFSAMEWSHTAFEAAAQAAVYRQLMREPRAEQHDTESDRVARLTRRCQREVNQRVRSPMRSTSPTAVLANQELAAAWGSGLQLLVESGL